MIEKQSVSIIITHATILTMDDKHSIVENGAIAIDKDIIIGIGDTESILNNYQAEKLKDASGCIVIPGLINAHSHIPMSYFRGVADDLELDIWLQKYIWPLEKKYITPQFVFDASVHGAAEMIRNGITLTSDMYFHGRETAKALSQVGLRGVIGQAIVDFQLVENGGIDRICRFAVEMEETYRDNPLINFSLAPHAIYTCSTPTLEKCIDTALQHDLIIQIHLSETEQEIKDSISSYGKLPVQYLNEIGMLKAKLILAHGIYVSEPEMELLAMHDTAIAICTESNLKLAAGIAPLKNYFKHNVRCCFATDGVASNNNLDLLSEMDFTAKLHKVINQDPTFLPAEQVLSMATCEAAKALHKYDELGSLEAGKKADIVILDCNSLEGQPLYHPYSQVVYSLGGKAVRDVFINGEQVLNNKTLTKTDESELINKAKAYSAVIRRDLKP